MRFLADFLNDTNQLFKRVNTLCRVLLAVQTEEEDNKDLDDVKPIQEEKEQV